MPAFLLTIIEQFTYSEAVLLTPLMQINVLKSHFQLEGLDPSENPIINFFLFCFFKLINKLIDFIFSRENLSFWSPSIFQ